MTKKRKNGVGSSFGDYLAKEGIREEVEDRALQEIIADQLTLRRAANAVGRTLRARRMQRD
jgi:hypothetical protein